MGYNRGRGGRGSFNQNNSRQVKKPPHLVIQDTGHYYHVPKDRRNGNGERERGYYDYFPAELEGTPINPNPHGDVSMETPKSSSYDHRILTRAAKKALAEKGRADAWQRLLRPLTDENPLPVEYVEILGKHFAVPPSHRPAALGFQGFDIEINYSRFRNETSCFVCSALCDKILKLQAEYASKRIFTPRTPRAQFSLTRSMTAFLRDSPLLEKFLVEISLACKNKDADHLRRYLVRPDQASREYGQFLESLKEELQRNCPPGKDGPLEESLGTLTLAGWLAAGPVVLDYLRLIRDWVKEDTPQKIADLKKMIEDVSTFSAMVKVMSAMKP